MIVTTKLPREQLWEIRDHRDNTSKELIKAYTLSQLSIMDGIDTRTIKNSKKYIPIRVDDSICRHKYKRGITKKPYRTLYVRLDEIKYIFNKKSGQKLTIDV